MVARGTELPLLEEQLQNALIERIDELRTDLPRSSEGDGSQIDRRRVVTLKPADLAPKTILDSEEDVEEFVNNLQAHLLSQVKDNRIRIQ